jgi:hypothetical protein
MIFDFVLGDLAISLIKGPLEALLGIAYGNINSLYDLVYLDYSHKNLEHSHVIIIKAKVLIS